MSSSVYNHPWKTPGGPLYHPDTPYELPDGSMLAAGAIPYFMSRPTTDARFMPVTRDLSPNKITTVLYFCYNLIQKAKPGGPE